MYQPVLNRFLSRDPLPPDGQPDILYGDDWIKQNIAMRTNPYIYVGNNSPNRVEPTGIASKDSRSLRFPQLQASPFVFFTTNEQGTPSDSGEDLMTPPAAECAVALPIPAKPACDTVRAPSAVQKDKLGNVSCKQIVAGVFLWLKQETVTVNGVATFVDMCYGCRDNSCKTDKMPKKKCGLTPKAVARDIRYECKCVGPDK